MIPPFLGALLASKAPKPAPDLPLQSPTVIMPSDDPLPRWSESDNTALYSPRTRRRWDLLFAGFELTVFEVDDPAEQGECTFLMTCPALGISAWPLRMKAGEFKDDATMALAARRRALQMVRCRAKSIQEAALMSLIATRADRTGA